MVMLSALSTGRLYPPGNIPGTHFCQRLSRPQGHSSAGRIISMKNFNDTIGNQTRDLLACSSVPQPTTIPRVPPSKGNITTIFQSRRKADVTKFTFQIIWYLTPKSNHLQTIRLLLLRPPAKENKNSEAYVTNYTKFNINLDYFYSILFSSLFLRLCKNFCNANLYPF